MKIKARLGILFLSWLATISGLPVIAQSGTFLTPMKTDGYRLTSSPFTLSIPVSVSQDVDIESLRIEVIDVSLEKSAVTTFLPPSVPQRLKRK